MRKLKTDFCPARCLQLGARSGLERFATSRDHEAFDGSWQLNRQRHLGRIRCNDGNNSSGDWGRNPRSFSGMSDGVLGQRTLHFQLLAT
jgi:hypothetical protein